MALIVGAFSAARRRPKPAPKVETATVALSDITRTVSASGKIQPFSLVDVKSKASGTLIKMVVEEGTRVRAGQLICLIDRRDNQVSYNQALADVQSARSALQSAQANAALTDAQLGPQIRSATESVAASRARLVSARSSLQQQRESAAAAVSEARSAVAAAQARLNSSRQDAQAQPSLTGAAIDVARANVASSEASVNSARQNLRQLQNSTLPNARAQAQSAIADAQSNLSVAQKNYARQKQLFERGFIAANTLDSFQNQLDVANSAVVTAKSRLDTLEADQDAQRLDAESKVVAAIANLSNAKAALVQATAGRVQDRLKTSEVKAQLAALDQARAGLRTALASSRQIAQREADIQAELATLRQGEANIENVRAQKFQSAARRADITASRASLQKALQEAEQRARNLAQTTVTSPRDGLVMQKYVDTGAIIQSGESGFSGGTSIVQLADVTRLFVIAQVDESDIADIRSGQAVDISIDAFPDKTFKGRVRKIFPNAQVENNVTTVKVQIELLQADPQLRANLNATCDFLLERKANRPSVPTEAIREEGKKMYISVLKADGTQDKREVKIGTRGDGRTEILLGVRLGEKVVLPEPEPTAPAGGMFD